MAPLAVDPDKKQKCIEVFEKCWDIAIKAYPSLCDRRAKPRLVFECASEMKAVAGQARHGSNECALNEYFINTEFDDMIEETIPHEISHFIIRRTKPFASSHGKEWKNVMRRIFKVEPSTYHTYDISELKELNIIKSRAKMRIHYYCTDCNQKYKLPITKHKRWGTYKGPFFGCSACKSTGTVVPEFTTMFPKTEMFFDLTVHPDYEKSRKFYDDVFWNDNGKDNHFNFFKGLTYTAYHNTPKGWPGPQKVVEWIETAEGYVLGRTARNTYYRLLTENEFNAVI